MCAVPDRLVRYTACVSFHIRLISSAGIVDLRAAARLCADDFTLPALYRNTSCILGSILFGMLGCQRQLKENRKTAQWAVLVHCMLLMTGLSCTSSCHIHVILPAVYDIGAH